MSKAFLLILFLFVVSISKGWCLEVPAMESNFDHYPGQNKNKKLPRQSGSGDYIAALKKVTDVMVNDVTSPVAASRYYAYVTITAYEIQSLFDAQNYPSLVGYVKRLNKINASDTLLQSADPALAVILSIFKSGQKLLPSGYLLKKQIDSVGNLYKKTKELAIVYTQTLLLVDEVVKQMLVCIKADGFTTLNNQPRYTLKDGDAYWKPTAPAFMGALEPHWNTIKTFILDSAQQFKVALPAAYDTAKTSAYFKALKEVYAVSRTSTKAQKAIAMFWDCNPFAVQQIGHVEFGIKKISPGGHWIGITGIACIKQQLPLGKTALVHALVSIALADAFIACWDEKYRSNRVRPETAIQKLIDPRWYPLLQTPPFPEYVSGHSVASSAAAFTLTVIFGNHFFYVDVTETEFGLPARKYNSFKQAAAEAAISRLYGGIHYRDAIYEGGWLGTKVGEFATKRLKIYFDCLIKK